MRKPPLGELAARTLLGHPFLAAGPMQDHKRPPLVDGLEQRSRGRDVVVRGGWYVKGVATISHFRNVARQGASQNAGSSVRTGTAARTMVYALTTKA